MFVVEKWWAGNQGPDLSDSLLRVGGDHRNPCVSGRGHMRFLNHELYMIVAPIKAEMT